MKKILVGSKQHFAADIFHDVFGPDCKLELVSSKSALDERIATKQYDFVIIDIEFCEIYPEKKVEDYRRDLNQYWKTNPHAEIIIVTPQERVREAVKVVKAGAGNYLTYPLIKEEIHFVLDSLYESFKIQSELDYLRDKGKRIGEADRIARLTSQAMNNVYEKVKLVASSQATVLLLGETGTGKGVIARLIHALSPQKDGPYVSIHCGAIPETLIESELFGHEKGSFTGAVKRQLGKFELGAKGTVLLDEIGTIGPSTQIKLLQVLHDKVFHRIGGDKEIPLESRIIAATNVDLKTLKEEGTFRSDLYYRLNVFPIDIPPLRDRKEDVLTLAEHFLQRLDALQIKEIHGFHPLVIEALESYQWPGNVRELENIIERAFLLETSHILTQSSFPAELFRSGPSETPLLFDPAQTLTQVRKAVVHKIEKSYLHELLGTNKGRIGSSAKQAGITSRQLHNLMSRHGIKKENYK